MSAKYNYEVQVAAEIVRLVHISLLFRLNELHNPNKCPAKERTQTIILAES